ncbi:MAG: hypothetical protein A2W99_04775 [Bacteroidetes bacterium GWF2_33_16]|nr:MAG: hypothetical protein A2X00_17295 [Bacteroidetes bacterium GWE2_32_14]OFY05983.1 MAG: hypothetical protein A2W99_04775 [Bacteroidetes bacterium GWF2_33_16]
MRLNNSNILRYLNSNLLLTSVLINLILFIIVYTLFIPVYNTNDDVAMMFIVSGVRNFTQPSEFMIFSNIFIGYILKILYNIYNNFIWYELYLIFCLFISHVAILYVLICRSISKKITILSYLLYFLLIGIVLLLNLQFTIIATFITIAGAVLIVFNSDSKPITLQLITGILFIVLGSLIRFKSCYLGLLVFFPLFCYFIYVNYKRFFSKRNIKIYSSFFIAITLSFLFFKADRYLYSKSNNYEKQFYEFNRLRSNIIDYKVLELNSDSNKQKILTSINWSENDYFMLSRWFFFDENKYSINNLKKIVEDKNQKQRISTFKIIESIKWCSSLFNKEIIIFSVSITLFFIVLFDLKKKELFFVLLYYIFNLLLLILIYIFTKAPPFRVYITIFGFSTLIPLILNKKNDVIKGVDNYSNIINGLKYFNWKKSTSVFRNLFLIINIAFFLKFAIACCFINWQNSRIISEKNKQFKKKIETLSNLNKKYVNWNAIPWEQMPVFESKKFLNSINIIGLGCANFTTLNKKILDSNNINNLYLDLVLDDNLYLLSNNNDYELYLKYMKENYKMDIQYKEIKNETNYKIIKFFIEN